MQQKFDAIILDWQEPRSNCNLDGGSSGGAGATVCLGVEEYAVEGRHQAGENWTVWAAFPGLESLPATSSVALVTDLEVAKSPYQFRVLARSAVGWSAPSAHSVGIEANATTPDPPSLVLVTQDVKDAEFGVPGSLSVIVVFGEDKGDRVTSVAVEITELASGAKFVFAAEFGVPLNPASSALLSPTVEATFATLDKDAVGFPAYKLENVTSATLSVTTPSALLPHRLLKPGERCVRAVGRELLNHQPPLTPIATLCFSQV